MRRVLGTSRTTTGELQKESHKDTHTETHKEETWILTDLGGGDIGRWVIGDHKIQSSGHFVELSRPSFCLLACLV